MFMTKKLYRIFIGYLLLIMSGIALAQTPPAPLLPSVCPDLSKSGSVFDPAFWQIQLRPLANAGQLQTNTQITKMQGAFQSAIWSHYVVCNYSSRLQGNFSLQSKFVTVQPSLPSASTLVISNKGWRTVGYVILCTSADAKDCPFKATYLVPQQRLQQKPSDLNIQPQDTLPHVPTN